MFHSSYTGETRLVDKLRDEHEVHLIGQEQGIIGISWKQDSKNLEDLAHLCPCPHQTQPQYWNRRPPTPVSLQTFVGLCCQSEHAGQESQRMVNLNRDKGSDQSSGKMELLQDRTPFHLLEQRCVALVLLEVRKSRTWRPHSSGTCPAKCHVAAPVCRGLQ